MKAKIAIWLCCLAAIAVLLWIKKQRQNSELTQLLFEHQRDVAALDRWVQDNPKDKISDDAIRGLVNQLLVPKEETLAYAKLSRLEERAVPILVEALDDPPFLEVPNTSGLRTVSAPVESVLNLLRPYGPPSSIQPLTELLKSNDQLLRKEAALALGNVATEQSLPAVQQALASTNAGVRLNAMMGIENALRDKRGSAKFFTAVFDAIVPLLDGQQQKISHSPAETLLAIDKERAAKVIVEDRFFHLKNPNLARSLSALNEHEAAIPEQKIRGLMRAIGENYSDFPNSVIYGECLMILARNRAPDAEAHIQKALSNASVAEHAAEALATLRGVPNLYRISERASQVGFANLTKPEKAIVSVWMLDGEVRNGGFHQYFFNSAGDHAAEALEALRSMRADQTAALLQKAIALFGSKGPSPDREKRMAQLDKFSTKADDKLGELDEQFFENPDKLRIKLLLYAAANASSFTTNK